jgi:succinate-semialdehyde dehydrogenase/glutarate-semialdehyde dehydrogenase
MYEGADAPDEGLRDTRSLIVGGERRPATGGATFAVEDPATGNPICRVADATVEDARLALDAAAVAQPGWQAVDPAERAAILRRAEAIVHDEADAIAAVISAESGKTRGEALGEVVYSAGYLGWFAGEAERISGRYEQALRGPGRTITTRRPVGPCLLITPWNFPLAMAARKVAPAIAAGCVSIIKPAELAPLATFALAGVLERAGLPAGVVNVLTTTDAPNVVQPLLADPRLRKLSFTGSTAVGRTLLAAASQRVLRTSMELGGNAPFIVFADADLEHAVEQALVAKLRNSGEACTAANRFLVEAPVAERFAEMLAARVAEFRAGPATDPGSDVGPVIDARAVDKIGRLVSDAVERGAQLLTGGGQPDGPGYFVAPTVVAGVPPEASILHEEIFGPVAAVASFVDEREAIERANASEYGLAGYVFTGDLARGLRVGEALEVGMVGLNKGGISNVAAPFGGVKASGLGREGGPEGIDEYLDVQTLAFDLAG